MKYSKKLSDAAEFLKSKSYTVVLINEDYIQFTKDTNTWLLSFDKNDPKYIRIIYPHFYMLNDENRQKAVSASLTANSQTKLAKIIESEGSLSVVVEGLHKSSTEYKEFFNRYIEIIGAILYRFSNSNK